MRHKKNHQPEADGKLANVYSKKIRKDKSDKNARLLRDTWDVPEITPR